MILSGIYCSGCCTSCAVRVRSGQIRQPEALGISAELKAKVGCLLQTSCALSFKTMTSSYCSGKCYSLIIEIIFLAIKYLEDVLKTTESGTTLFRVMHYYVWVFHLLTLKSKLKMRMRYYYISVDTWKLQINLRLFTGSNLEGILHEDQL
ncbi:hypothetical protein GW17_00025738 [Ensete ventricosum]|nr:hypothetical protein GW17_00025738 [Ensete ventricosum]